MTTHDIAATFRRYIEEVDPAADVAALPDSVHPDIVLPRDIVPNGRQGIEGMREHLEYLSDKLDYRSTIQDLLVDGDRVAARVRVEGRVIGTLMEFEPSDRRFSVEEFLIARFTDGKISEVWRLLDLMTLTQQLKG